MGVLKTMRLGLHVVARDAMSWGHWYLWFLPIAMGVGVGAALASTLLTWHSGGVPLAISILVTILAISVSLHGFWDIGRTEFLMRKIREVHGFYES